MFSPARRASLKEASLVMNKTLIAFLSAASIFVISACGQGTFQNLDFEAARLVYLSPFSPAITTTDVLPVGTAFSGFGIVV